MACSLPKPIDEIMALVYKLIAGDRARQQALCELSMQFDKEWEAKDNLRQAYV